LLAVAAELLSQEKCAFDVITRCSTSVLPTPPPLLLLLLVATLASGAEDLL
jgi:hypothetical protein